MSEESRDFIRNDDPNLGGFVVGYPTSPPKKVRRRSLGTEIVPKPKDADYCYSIPPLIDEVEELILARVPRSEYWNFFRVCKRFLALLKSGELYKIRSELGHKELSVFVSPGGDRTWWEFDRHFKSCRKLPNLPAEESFIRGDRESLCAGTHLLVSGIEVEGLVWWRYDMKANIWSRGPSMINPRCLFASATCGSHGYVAGGFGMVETGWEVMNCADRYNPETKSWEPLPNMIRKRKHCSGCYMDNKFYVIGGTDPEGRYLSCAEAFDMEKKKWELIPDMLEPDDAQDQDLSYTSPPLIAVVNNELYFLKTSTNELKVYIKRTNSWKKMGTVPVRADATLGWGIAFKSLGNELLAIQSSQNGPSLLHTCCPNLNAEELRWEALEHGKNPTCFIVNCSVMAA